MMLGYNNYPSRTHHHLHNHFSPTRGRQQLDDNNSNITHDYSGSSSFHPTTPTSQQQTFDDSTLRAAAASAIGINGQSLNQVPDLMPSESWMVHNQHTPTAAQRFSHQRESSLSSLGSNGPASPYNPNLSNPHIAVTDSGSDGYHELNSGDSAYSYRPNKSMADNFYTSALANYSSRNHHRNSANNGHTAVLDMGFHDGLPSLSPSSPAQQKLRSDRGLAPAPELSASRGSSTASHPVSVASSTADDDSPHTPSLQEPEDHARRRKNGLLNPPPKLDRTLTDIYTDELYNPNFTLTSASPPQTVAMSPTNDIFAQRLQAANSHHLSAAQSPESGISRERSPFRQGSPYASTVSDFSHIGMNQVRLGSAQQMREKRKAEQDSREIQQQFARNAARQHGTPNTISPKDAVLDFNDTDDASNFPLFPPQEASAFNNINSMNKNHDNGAAPQQQSNQPFRSMDSATPVQSAFDFSMPANIQMPQQYPFIPRPQQEHHQQPATPSNSNFSRVSSAEASTPDYGDGSVQKPSGTKADGGTYTCTYHGCTLRFETPALLQKHKREGHRQANALNALRDSPVGGMTSSVLNSQAGPHKCERINPSTGKPCNTIFSRPYDLTRHEDTIHNARKQKVRCDLCTEEKTFSRADALTRHYRVCHPDVEFPGKHRRRGGGIS